jgi:beta-lactamase class A
MISLKNKQFSLLHIFLATIVVTIGTYYLTSLWKEKEYNEQLSSASIACNYDIKRMKGFKFIKPLMFIDEDCESDMLMNTKQKLISIIDKYHSIGEVNIASVYLREYEHNEWMCINLTEKFDPGSLFKVPTLITILKMNELHPGLLDKSITYNKKLDFGRSIKFPSKQITIGQTYTVRELLSYMIKYSDNDATALLESVMDAKVLQKLFSDFGLEVPNIYASQYKFNVKEYSYFMRAIYNAGYLSSVDSEYAAELLSQCDFKEGIVKGLPDNTIIAHKFGEAGNQTEIQLHESGIIYLNNKPYLLTIMTKGKDIKKLAQIIAELSKSVYTDMAMQANATM